MGKERIQKILAAAGVGSRRKCEEMIKAGRITINGRTAQIGESADAEKDTIAVNGKVIQSFEKKVYIALYKPRRILSTTHDERGRRTVLDLVPVEERIYPVGRLDFDSEGLILLTNDGALAQELSHPRYGHEKEYQVLLEGEIDEEAIERWRNGVVLEDGHKTGNAKVERGGKSGRDTWVSVILKEGHKRQIRATAECLGMHVKRLMRTRIGSLTIGELRPGEWRRLSQGELKQLKRKPAKREGANRKGLRNPPRVT